MSPILAKRVMQEIKKERSKDASGWLGIHVMPTGYALMCKDDESYYYIREDGKKSQFHWDKWVVYKWAEQDRGRRK
jgi:hypothetical protein